MSDKFNIKKAFAGAIEATQDPLAPIKLQDLHKYAAAVGRMLVPCSSTHEVRELSDKLLKNFTNEELNTPNPTFVIALCACLTEALVLLGRSYADDPTLKKGG